MTWKFTEKFSGINEKYLRKDPPEGACQWATSPWAAATPLGRAMRACGAHVAPPPPNSALYLPFRLEKNQREGFIAFCDTEAPPHPVLHLEGRSGVRLGLRRGEIVAIVIINLLPSLIPWSSSSFVSNLIVGLLHGDELDEIYHVIELVLDGDWSLVSTMF